MVLLPTFKAILPDELPLVTTVPFTVTIAEASFVVGVIVNDVTALPTETVYAVVGDENPGFKVPLLSARPARLASADAGLVTMVVYVCVVVPS